MIRVHQVNPFSIRLMWSISKYFPLIFTMIFTPIFPLMWSYSENAIRARFQGFGKRLEVTG